MSAEAPVSSLLRRPAEHGHAPVGYIELLFDLVYVFAVTQLSHHLVDNLSWEGALQTLILFLAVWWAWIYTTWATNWIDPDRAPNRLMLGLAMICSLVMSSAIPHAFDGSGLAFALAYVAVQLGRSLYVLLVMGETKRGSGKKMTRITIWFVVSAPFWIIGGLAAEPEARMLWWAAALVIELLGPLCFYRVPGLGRSRVQEWAIAGGHMAERSALFIIIALGEGIVMTGSTFGHLPSRPDTIAAFVTAFVGTFAMWWIYFDIGAKRGAEHIEHHANPGIVGRNAFTYWHIPIVAGIILIAVSDELTLVHPLEPVHGDFLLVTAAGMLLFLIGTMSFKRISSGNSWYPVSHVVGLWLTAALALWGALAHPLTLYFYMVSSAIFCLVALWEWGSFHGGWVDRMERRGWWLGRVLRSHTTRVDAGRQRKAGGG